MTTSSDAGAAAPAPAAPAATGGGGGAAILAKLRAQRAATAAGTTPSAPAPASASGAAASAAPPTQPAVTAAAPAAPAAAAAKPAEAAPAGPRPAVGGAAILARLRAQRDAKAATAATAPKPAAKREVVVLYASQTGTAQEIARTIQAEAEQRGLPSQVASLNEYSVDTLFAAAKQPGAAGPPLLVLVAASTGDGDPPDNSAKFYTQLRRKSHAADSLKGVGYTVLGLGDSNYTRFMAVPRALAKRFSELGATEFFPGAEADEVDGIESTIDPWVERLWPVLQSAAVPSTAAAAEGAAPPPQQLVGAAPPEKVVAGVPPPPRCRVRLVWAPKGQQQAAAAAAVGIAGEDEEGYSADRPFLAAVSDARWLTTPAAGDRKVLHMELDLSGSGLSYHPGDSISVLPQNDPALVEALLQRLGADGDAVIAAVLPADADGVSSGAAPAEQQQQQQQHLLPHLRTPCSLRAALGGGCDLTSPPRKSLLRLLAAHCTAPAEAQALLRLCSAEGREEYKARMLEGQPNLLQLLQEYPSCQPPLDALLDVLPPLAARAYSISCSPLEHPEKAQVAFTVVRFSTAAYGEHRGVATTWLEALCGPAASAAAAAAAAKQPEAASRAAADAAAASALSSVPRMPVFLRKGGVFAPPAELSAPVLMIGPGTGVTPFRGFLQHRRQQLTEHRRMGASEAAGLAWLFFGCRHPEQDFLYQDDLESFAHDGTLDALFLAFSRAPAHRQRQRLPLPMAQDGREEEQQQEQAREAADGQHAAQGKVYVQHLMEEQSADLYRQFLSRPNAYVFVCGDGAQMAKDVHACLAGILEREGGMGAAEAAAVLTDMTKQGQYVRDIWS